MSAFCCTDMFLLSAALLSRGVTASSMPTALRLRAAACRCAGGAGASP